MSFQTRDLHPQWLDVEIGPGATYLSFAADGAAQPSAFVFHSDKEPATGKLGLPSFFFLTPAADPQRPRLTLQVFWCAATNVPGKSPGFGPIPFPMTEPNGLRKRGRSSSEF